MRILPVTRQQSMSNKAKTNNQKTSFGAFNVKVGSPLCRVIFNNFIDAVDYAASYDLPLPKSLPRNFLTFLEVADVNSLKAKIRAGNMDDIDETFENIVKEARPLTRKDEKRVSYEIAQHEDLERQVREKESDILALLGLTTL